MLVVTIYLCVHITVAERLNCFCQNANCDDNNSCTFNRGEGICIAYYYQNTTTLIQLCGTAFQLLVCQANNAVSLGATNVICCLENYCNSQEALDSFYVSSNRSQSTTAIQTTTTTIATQTTTTHTTTKITSTQSTVSPTPTIISNQRDEQLDSSDSSPPTYAIVLSVMLPLIIIAVFGIAIVMFLLYIRLYIKHQKQNSSKSIHNQPIVLI